MKQKHTALMLCAAIIIGLFSASCNTKKSNPDEEGGPSEYEYIDLSGEYNEPVYFGEDWDESDWLESGLPSKICIVGDTLWIGEKSRIIIIDKETGDVIKSISIKLPSSIPFTMIDDITLGDDGYVYAAIGMMKRINVYTQDGTLADEIYLDDADKYDSDSKYYAFTRESEADTIRNIAYFGGKLYMTSRFFNGKPYIGIYEMDIGTEIIKKTFDGLSGHIETDSDGNVYVAEEYAHSWDTDDNGKTVSSFSNTGKKYISRIKNGVLEKDFIWLKDDYWCSDIKISGGDIYVIINDTDSVSYIHKFGIDGTYKGVIFDRFPRKFRNGTILEGFGLSLGFDVDEDGTVYAINHSNGFICKLVRKAA